MRFNNWRLGGGGIRILNLGRLGQRLFWSFISRWLAVLGTRRGGRRVGRRNNVFWRGCRNKMVAELIYASGVWAERELKGPAKRKIYYALFGQIKCVQEYSQLLIVLLILQLDN
jgi:hypothetical protein